MLSFDHCTAAPATGENRSRDAIRLLLAELADDGVARPSAWRDVLLQAISGVEWAQSFTGADLTEAASVLALLSFYTPERRS